MINEDRVKQLFLDLVQINSPSRHERGVADYVSAKLRSLGLEVEEDNAGSAFGGDTGNVIGFKKGTLPGARKIFLCCHMDTVEPTENIRLVVDEEIRTDGSSILGADDKAGIAAVIEGIESVFESGAAHGDFHVLFDACEESGLNGARQLDVARIKDELGYVLDTQRPVGGITISAPSHETMTVEITGKAAHAGMAPEKGVSAIVAASRAIAKMKLGRIDEETTANIGVISGGKARNIVADHVTVTAEARSRNQEKLADQLEHMVSVFESEAAAMGAKAVVKSEREYNTYRWTESDEVVKLAAEAARRVGIEPSYQEGGGGSDANVFNYKGIPSVVIGVGYENAHSSSEYIRIDDLANAAQVAAAIILVAAESGG